MDEYGEMIKWHPHLVLISENPVTWHGLFAVGKNKIEIKLTVPNYPELKDVTLRFGKQISLMHDTDFAIKCSDLLNTATSVSSLLRQLGKLIENSMKKKRVDSMAKIEFLNVDALNELKSALEIPDIVVSGNDNLSAINLRYNDISITLKQGEVGNNSWIIVSSDLPELESWEPLEDCVPTLTDAANALRTRVDMLQEAWEDLANIDEHCWVIDPTKPKPNHLYRRIHLNPMLSLLITLDPPNPTSLQNMKLLGSDSEVTKYKEIMNENLENWSDDMTIVENLEQILEFGKLPKRPAESEKENVDGLVKDYECCICFCLELDNGEIPTEICSNDKCQRQFHTSCLCQWLQAVPGNQMVFERIHGSCPNCLENISCPIVMNEKIPNLTLPTISCVTYAKVENDIFRG